MKLVIPLLPKRYNEYNGTHWSVRKKNTDLWKKLVMAYMFKEGIRPPHVPLSKAVLKLTRHSSVPSDFDGLVQAFKPVIDSLIKMGVIKDDSMKVIGKPDYDWAKAPKGKGFVTIEVAEAQ